MAYGDGKIWSGSMNAELRCWDVKTGLCDVVLRPEAPEPEESEGVFP